jgi:heptosyltransferase-2
VRRFHDDNRLDPDSLLVVLPNWVGDVVMATPSLEAIRRRFPHAHITYLLRSNIRPLVEHSPWMDELETWPPRDRRDRQGGTVALGVRLRRRRIAWAVLLTNSFRSALVACLAGIPRRIGYARDARGWILTDRLAVPREQGRIARTRMVDYYGQLAWAIGCDQPGDRLVLHVNPQDERAIADRLAGAGPTVVMTPGASFGPAKCWLPERFAAVCDRLARECGPRIVVTYGPGEEELARRAVGAMTCKRHVMENPMITLGQLMAVVKRADLLLCNDTGPRHFAKAFGVPVVTVFGPTWPEWTDTEYEMERKVRIDVDCGPCQKPVCPEGHHKCMTGVTVEAVFDACRELLSRRLASAGQTA